MGAAVFYDSSITVGELNVETCSTRVITLPTTVLKMTLQHVYPSSYIEKSRSHTWAVGDDHVCQCE